MARQIIFYSDYFVDFYQNLGDKVKEKVKYVLELIKQVDSILNPKNEKDDRL